MISNVVDREERLVGLVTGAEAKSFGALAHDDMVELKRRAAELRDRHWGRAISYSRKVFVPLTTMCRNTCGYCVFVKHPGDPGAKFMTPDEVLAVAKNGERL